MSKLCVNIDHVATIRQARMTFEPSPIDAALAAIEGGADGITLHIREDRRHMQDADLFALKEILSVPLNLEMAATDEMVSLALETTPDMAMIVPEGRDEITTEGGLNVIDDVLRLTDVVLRLQEHSIPVSAFIDADREQIEAAKMCGFSVCEIHTGPYAEAVINNDFDLKHEQVLFELEKVTSANAFIQEIGLQSNAGHGLTHHNVRAVANIAGLSELHIGHSIVSRSVFVGMSQSVFEMKERMKDTQG